MDEEYQLAISLIERSKIINISKVLKKMASYNTLASDILEESLREGIPPLKIIHVKDETTFKLLRNVVKNIEKGFPEPLHNIRMISGLRKIEILNKRFSYWLNNLYIKLTLTRIIISIVLGILVNIRPLLLNLLNSNMQVNGVQYLVFYLILAVLPSISIMKIFSYRKVIAQTFLAVLIYLLTYVLTISIFKF